MAENQTLRNLLRSLGTFIGEGAGGLLPKLGWDLTDFNNFINRSETDTAWEGYQRRKKMDPIPSGSQPMQSHKRPAEEETNSGRLKKLREGDETDGERGENGYPLVPMNPSLTANSMYTAASRPPDGNAIFSDLMRNSNGSPMFMQPSPPTTTSSQQYGGVSSSSVSYPSSYIPGVTMNIESPLAPLPYNTSNTGSAPLQQQQQPRMQQPSQLTPEQLEDDGDPDRNEAYKLIQ